MSLKTIAVAAFLLPLALVAADKPKISALERSQGWRLLDGSDVRGFRADKLPANWNYQKADGIFLGKSGAAMVTADEFADFELTFECKIAEGGAGKVYLRVSEDMDAPEKSGPVVLLSGYGDQFGGSGLREPDRKVKQRFDDWFRVKIALFGNEVTCWINGDRIDSYMIGSPDWMKAVAASAQPSVAKAADERSGRLVFAGEGFELRNVKVRAI